MISRFVKLEIISLLLIVGGLIVAMLTTDIPLLRTLFFIIAGIGVVIAIVNHYILPE